MKDVQTTMSIKNKILSNGIIKGVYKIKFYFNIAVSQVSFITAKLPELMAAIFLLEKVGVTINTTNYIIYGVTLFILVTLMGLVWHKSGMYETEIYVNAKKDPFQAELLEAARIIIKNNKEGNKQCQ